MKPVKVLAYITRQVSGGLELLVFDHHNIPEAGTQIIAGTVDEGEALEVALLREIHEESGLIDIKVKRLLLTINHFHTEKQQWQTRNYFQLESVDGLPNAWSHSVSAGREDKGMAFDFFWLPLTKARKRLVDEQSQAIDKLVINP